MSKDGALESANLEKILGTMPLSMVDNKLMLVDQRKLPFTFEHFDASGFEDLLVSIKDMVVRGAPSIGAVAAFGYSLEVARQADANSSDDVFWQKLIELRDILIDARPTAVNLRFAVEKVFQAMLVGKNEGRSQVELVHLARQEAERLYRELIEANRRISHVGAGLINRGDRILTHCNAGPLATCGYGTALGVIRAAHFSGKDISVLVDETRPRNQGARLTLWELMQDQIPCQLVCESMSGYLMKEGLVDLVITGADRIAANGDSANKIGTYNLAVLAKHHGIPFYIAAPLSTFDPYIEDGASIPIEMRGEEEVLTLDGQPHVPMGARALNPAFDVTPNELIAGLITEAGLIKPPFKSFISRLFQTI